MDIIIAAVIVVLGVFLVLVLLMKQNERNVEKILQDSARDEGQQQSQRILLLFNQLESRFQTLEMSNEQKMDQMRRTMIEQLDQVRGSVNEKLEKTLNERMNQSFNIVGKRLEQVYQGLGEMQTLANGVGDLKRVLGNVKTRGILGEIQLGSILSEIMAPEQYEENVAVVPGSTRVVEFAVKLPGEDGKSVFLPIDSKFPADAYHNLLDAYDTGDKSIVDVAAQQLVQRIRQFAKDIHGKYIESPYTTEYGIMFLPFEGLYAEAVNRGLVEILMREYKVNLAGPSTMAALLNSLQMGFRTLAIQKRSSEVWELLGSVRSEFDKFESVLINTQRRLDQANHELDQLVGVRTRQIQKKLKDVEKNID